MNTIGNEELEMEYLASKIISGILLPSDYVDLCSYISRIPIIEGSEKLLVLLDELKSEVISSLGLLKDVEINKYYYGENKEVLKLISSLLKETKSLIPVYEQAQLDKMDLEVSKLKSGMQGQSYVDMGDAINAASAESDEINRISLDTQQLKISKNLLESIISLYGVSLSKLPNKSMDTKITTKYKLFLLNLTNNLDKVTSNILLSSVMGRLIDSISVSIPKDNLDPFKLEISNNLLETLSNPKDYYKDCKTNVIVSSDVGSLFRHCYPEFSDKFLNMYLEDYDNMEYQDQINFRKCFAIPADDSQLLQLTNTYIKMSYT